MSSAAPAAATGTPLKGEPLAVQDVQGVVAQSMAGALTMTMVYIGDKLVRVQRGAQGGAAAASTVAACCAARGVAGTCQPAAPRRASALAPPSAHLLPLTTHPRLHTTHGVATYEINMRPCNTQHHRPTPGPVQSDEGRGRRRHQRAARGAPGPL